MSHRRQTSINMEINKRTHPSNDGDVLTHKSGIKNSYLKVRATIGEPQSEPQKNLFLFFNVRNLPEGDPSLLYVFW